MKKRFYKHKKKPTTQNEGILKKRWNIKSNQDQQKKITL